MEQNESQYDPSLQLGEIKGVKGMIKRIIRKCNLFLLGPYIQFQNAVNEQLNVCIEQINSTIFDIKQRQEEMAQRQEEMGMLGKNMQADIALLQNHVNKAKEDMGACARQIMFTKWKLIDSLLDKVESDTDVLTCKICGYSNERRNFETKETECIFNGGKLTRYVCPKCGVIFGPSKFDNLGQKGVAEDYWVHYLGFSESDCSYKEERAFFMLNPTKEKVYLNYGCGHWSNTLQNLRERGYQVFGYEPYSPDIDNPYMITKKEQLEQMRFDGIFSNDVLEHFINPIEDMIFMKKLLKDGESKMAHCTSCYIYKYEYTRFHTHFFTGNSVNVLAEKSGLKIVECCDDMKENDFFCYVYGLDDN